MSGRSVRATTTERTQHLPGDELIADLIGASSQAVTIRRPPRDVWPWIAQMGAGTRGGRYSYDFLDNGRQPSADWIRPDLQRLSVAMIFPALPGVRDGFVLLDFEPDRVLILGWRAPDGRLLVSWVFVLQDVARHGTRLLVRARAAAGYRFLGLPWSLGKPLAGLVHFIMERKQLLEIARRAESMEPCS